MLKTMLKQITVGDPKYGTLATSGPVGGARSPDQGIFGAIDSRALWLQLSLSSAQVARLTGIPARRISRWASRGWLVPTSRNPMRYSGQAVEQAILLDRALASGVEPGRALRLAQVHQECPFQRDESTVGPASRAPMHPGAAHDFAEAALRMLLLDVLEGTPDAPRPGRSHRSQHG